MYNFLTTHVCTLCTKPQPPAVLNNKIYLKTSRLPSLSGEIDLFSQSGALFSNFAKLIGSKANTWPESIDLSHDCSSWSRKWTMVFSPLRKMQALAMFNFMTDQLSKQGYNFTLTELFCSWQLVKFFIYPILCNLFFSLKYKLYMWYTALLHIYSVRDIKLHYIYISLLFIKKYKNMCDAWTFE